MAGVVRDGRFSGQLINGKTQIVIMDEWTSDSLNCDDAKKLLQGKNAYACRSSALLVVFISLKRDLSVLNTFVRDLLYTPIFEIKCRNFWITIIFRWINANGTETCKGQPISI